MANQTLIQLIFLPDNADRFETVLEESEASDRFPGLMEGNFMGEPGELEAFKDLKFFGMHGAHSGAYPAALVMSRGADEIFSHQCDEEGHISLYASNPFDLAASPLTIPITTLQFTLVLHNHVSQLLDEAAELIEARMKDIEEKERKTAPGPVPD